MPVSSFVATNPNVLQSPRPAVRRWLDKRPLYHGEKPYEQLVSAAFDGPVLRLSQRLRLLEEADNRGIRRGDAIDLIDAMRHELAGRHALPQASPGRTFAKRFAALVAVYAVLALACCLFFAAR